MVYRVKWELTIYQHVQQTVGQHVRDMNKMLSSDGQNKRSKTKLFSFGIKSLATNEYNSSRIIECELELGDHSDTVRMITMMIIILVCQPPQCQIASYHYANVIHLN